jgi:hypothetical protein
MKRIILLAMALLLVICGYAVAAESVTAELRTPGRFTNTRFYVVSFVSAADGSFTDVALNDISGVHSRENFSGWYLDKVEYIVGDNAPTNESDVVLYRSSTQEVDLLEGEGSGFIDNATNSTIQVQKMLTGQEVLSISNNDVDSAEFTLIFQMYRW